MNIRQDDRKRHIYLSGKTQFGKTTCMISMAYQDMRNGMGLCFIDPKGQDIDKLLDWVPANRKQDVIYLDLKTPIPIDFMATKDDDERSRLVSDIAQIFDRLENGLGSKMGAILKWIVSSLHLIGKSTFMDIYAVLTDASVREKIRQHPAIRQKEKYRQFWDVQAEKLMKTDSAVALCVTRMTDFILSDALEIILGTPNAELNIEKAVEDRQIILVRLQPNSSEAMLYGSLIVSKITQAIYRRDPKNNNHPFALYVDEFHNFQTSGFDQVLADVGGLGLYLTLANHYFNQLSNSKVSEAIINLVSTFFLFNQDPSNAGKLAGILRNAPPTYLEVIDQRIAELEKSISTKNANYIQQAKMINTLPLLRPSLGSAPFDIPDLHCRLKQAEAHRDSWSECLNKLFTSGYEDGGVSQAKYSAKMIEAQIQIDGITELLGTTPAKSHKSFLEQLPAFPAGRCIYRAATGDTTIIKCPLPPDPRSVGKTSHAQWIRENTLAIYGPKRPIRAGENTSSQMEPEMFKSEDEGQTLVPHTRNGGDTQEPIDIRSADDPRPRTQNREERRAHLNKHRQQ
jgi:hypothetical protein